MTHNHDNSAPKDAIERVEKKQDELAASLNQVREDGIHRKIVLERAVSDISAIHSTMESMDKKIGEYNQQLVIHIAGVQELREANRLMREAHQIQGEAFEARLAKVEAPFKWWDWTSTFLEKLGYLIAAAAALYGLYQFVIQHLTIR